MLYIFFSFSVKELATCLKVRFNQSNNGHLNGFVCVVFLIRAQGVRITESGVTLGARKNTMNFAKCLPVLC